MVIGAPASATDALAELLGSLPGELPAALFVVQHGRAGHRELLEPSMLAKASLPSELAKEGDRVRKSRIYLAPRDHHLLIEADHLVVGHGPKLQGFCPSADLTFMSAATSYGERVVGVALSGLLEDASAGLQVICDRGGVAVVEAADRADVLGGPELVRVRELAYRATLREMPALLMRLCSTPHA